MRFYGLIPLAMIAGLFTAAIWTAGGLELAGRFALTAVVVVFTWIAAVLIKD